jgi:hypothetical protein
VTTLAFLFADRVRVNTATTGTGTINLGTAITGFRTFATAVTAGSLASGCSIYYAIEDTAGAWEIGTGVYTAGAPDTLTRVVGASSLGGTTALTLSGTAQIYLTLTALSTITALLSGGSINSTTIGASAATTGAFTTLSASSTVSGAGFTALVSPYAPIVSPSLTGTPLSITAATSTNTTQIATTAYVLGQVSTSTPAALGTAAVGTSLFYARADHVHLLPTRNTIDQGTQALTMGTSLATNCATGNIFTITLTSNATLANPTNLQPGAHYMWVIKQDGTGSRTLAYSTVFKWANTSPPTLTTAANAIDIITAISDGTSVYAVLSANFG